MNILALDTSGYMASGAVLCKGEIIASFDQKHGRTHSHALLPAVDNMLTAVNMRMADIDVFASVVGPGSFTGIRIGVETIKSFAQAFSAPCAAVDTLESLVWNVPYFSGTILPMLDARNKRVFSARHSWVEGKPQRLEEICARKIDDFDFCSEDENVLILGDGALCYREYFATIPECTFAKSNCMLQRASSAACAAEEKAKANDLLNYNALLPQYFILSQAENEYINKKGGKDFGKPSV